MWQTAEDINSVYYYSNGRLVLKLYVHKKREYFGVKFLVNKNNNSPRISILTKLSINKNRTILTKKIEQTQARTYSPLFICLKFIKTGKK